MFASVPRSSLGSLRLALASMHQIGGQSLTLQSLTAWTRPLSTSPALAKVTSKSPEVLTARRKFNKEEHGADDVTTEGVVSLDALAAEEAAPDGDGGALGFQAVPTPDVFDRLFDGVKFKDLPVVTGVLHKNNTRMWAHDATYENKLAYTSTNLCGYFHSQKRSAVASQAVGTNMGQQLRTQGVRTVRVRLDGFNMGRVACLKGLVNSGIKVVSISDVTRVDWGWRIRPKKRPRK